jgi:uroporphyrin-III C-methyltransferase/precorrin-2 dehydrogenase/sirohydrochlorin ferrochelatase
MHSLPIFVRLADAPVILIGAGEAAQAKRRLIERAGGLPVAPDDVQAQHARLAFVALEDDEAAQDVAAKLKARGLLVNVVDRPALCDFTTPAIVDRAPVLIAVGTGGASAGLAKAIRQRIEQLLPERLGMLATALQTARSALRARWSDARARRLALDAALAPGGPLDPLADPSPEAVPAWLAQADDPPQGRTETILLASTDPEDLTLRAARLLGEADRIIHAATVPPAILHRARADAERIAGTAGKAAPSAPGLTVILTMANDRNPS